MYDLVMKVKNEIKSEMEVSAINETLDARKMMFATDAASKRNCIRSSTFHGIFKQVSELCSKQNEICNGNGH